MLKVVIFDFDGVIADSLPALEKAARKVLERLKYPFPAISREDPLWKIMFKDMKLNAFQRLRLINAMKKEMSSYKEDIPVFSGMREIILELSKKIKVMILSSNSKETISHILEKNNFPELEIVSDSSFFGKDKVLKRTLKKHNFLPSEIIYLGDEVRDVEACARARVEILVVNWGYNSEKALRKAGANHIIRKPEEILKFIKK